MTVEMENQQEDARLILNEDLIEFGLDVSNFQEAFLIMGQNFIKHKFVKETYPNALIEREKAYPTGLLTSSIGIAIPHTDPIHVIKGSMGIGVLKRPVIFKTMDTREEMEVSVIFMLAITHPSAQLKMLQKVIEIIKDDKTLLRIKESQNKKEILNLVRPFLEDIFNL
ncbi:PTS sugar transporter subunit IIA [Caldibacillus thermoamylovorans]|uniref:PTS sugar transporter subunit IIA n=1 Tax=Caldibacillus thermoamylovorans TaxID=35841 RepID=UPI00203BCD6B|nr:PTS sugar transporter subunit IIA [Caldibacillus thermoamylovorans]MCM3799933.1 PTS sugar transporter subunit IIA [Caldibacillus thermoamylovorans]